MAYMIAPPRPDSNDRNARLRAHALPIVNLIRLICQPLRIPEFLGERNIQAALSPALCCQALPGQVWKSLPIASPI